MYKFHFSKQFSDQSFILFTMIARTFYFLNATSNVVLIHKQIQTAGVLIKDLGSERKAYRLCWL